MEKMRAQEVTKYKLSITPERAIEAEIQLIPLKSLKLDPRNVRFKHLQTALTDEEMEKKIWDEQDTRSLYNEVRFSQGLSDPLLVDSNGVTREGNRRLVVLRQLQEDVKDGKVEMDPSKLDPVQCIVLPKDTSETDVAIYLARVHVSGKKEWKALNQAAHIYDLYNIYRLSYDQIREAVSISKLTARNMEQAYKKTLEYHAKYPSDQDWLGRYSYFYELYKKKQLRDEWATKEDNLEKFMEWISDGKVNKGMQVRELPKVINDPDAYEVFKEKGFEAGMEVLSEKDPAMGSLTYKELSKTLKTLEEFPRNELLDTVRNRAKLQLLEKLSKELESLIKDIKSAARVS